MSPERTDSRLLEAALDVTSSLDLQRILENFVERACALTGARYDDVRRIRRCSRRKRFTGPASR